MDETDKAYAIGDLLTDARSQKGSPTSALRAARACKRLGLTRGEAWRVLAWLSYCDYDGKPYEAYAAKWDRIARLFPQDSQGG